MKELMKNINLLLLLLSLSLLIEIDFSLGGSSPYSGTDKRNMSQFT